MLNPRSSSRRAFTLVELLVVVAVIALLIGILVPALGGARKEAQRLTIMNNLRSIATAVNSYGATNQVMPPSYVYGSKPTGGSWRVQDQVDDNPNENNGYVHWSYAVVGEDTTESEAFESPMTTNGGAPRTNPGPNAEDWELSWQRDDTSSSTPQANPTDRQARRVAFAGNAAIFPRNKFADPRLLGSSRKNILVNPSIIKAPSRTILATEFLDRASWRSIEDPADAPFVCKSHRSIQPFVALGQSSVYDEPDQSGRKKPQFAVPKISSLLSYSQLGESMLDQQSHDLNAVGRDHPGGDKEFGGTTHFLYLDGHVERQSLRDTLTNGLWGDRFYSLSGGNTKILNQNE